MLSGKYLIDEPEWEQVSSEAKDLVKKLLTYDSDKRISAHDALGHPWLKKMVKAEKVAKEVTIKTLKNLQNFRVSDQITSSFRLTTN